MNPFASVMLKVDGDSNDCVSVWRLNLCLTLSKKWKKLQLVQGT